MAAHRIPPRSFLFWFPLLLLIPTLACADGMFVWRNRGIDILEPEQKALIIQDAGWEDLVLEVKYSGKARDFGWIVPVPSRPTLKADKPNVFVSLSQMTQNGNEPVHAPDLPTLGTRGIDRVEMLEHARVGIYDTALLSAQNGAGLVAWLREHRYQVEGHAKAILDEYAAKGWLFVAARIAVPDSGGVEEKLREGTLQPLRFRFASAEPIFPLRVSAASGHSSEVLLYVVSRRPLRAADDQKVFWESQYCGSAWPWIWGELDPDAHYTALRGARPFLTKLRAKVEPDEMRDVRFASLQPLNFLSGADSSFSFARQRAHGASMLGQMRDTASTPVLIRFIRTPGRSEVEIRSGIWALGQIGTTEASEEVERWLDDPRPVLSRDAILTLQEAGSRAAIDHCLKQVARLPEEGQRTFSDDRWDPSVQYLLHTLRPSDLPLVNRVLPPSSGLVPEDYWTGPVLRRGDWIRLVLSDPVTMKWVCDSLVAQGAVTGDPSARTMSTGSVNGFPGSYWTGAAVAIGFLPGPEWRFFGHVMEKLQAFPKQRNAVLHRIANDPRLPEAGRVIAISHLDSPRPQEWSYLRRIWRSARSGQDSDLLLGMTQLGGPEGSVEFRVRACQVAYAFGRLRGVDDLRSMWAEVRGADVDDVLRGDVAYALALTDTAPAVEPLVEYVRTTWARKFVKPRLVNWGRYEKAPKADLLSDNGLDFEYRTNRVRGTISQRGSSAQIGSLIGDERLPPYFRLFWIPQAGLYREDRSDLVPVVERSIGQIEASAHGDSLLLDACTMARKMVQGSLKIRAGEFEF